MVRNYRTPGSAGARAKRCGRILDLLRDTGLAEEWLPQVDERSAARLLPGCGAETVARMLPTLHPHVNWRRMARQHPAETLAWIRQALGDVALPWRQWFRYAPALEELPAADVLALVRDFADPDSFPVRMERLARLLPDEAFALMHARRAVWSVAIFPSTSRLRDARRSRITATLPGTRLRVTLGPPGEEAGAGYPLAGGQRSRRHRKSHVEPGGRGSSCEPGGPIRSSAHPAAR